MIHKLKRRFTVLATVSMFILMMLLVSIINIINYSSVIKECDSVISFLNSTDFPVFEPKKKPDNPKNGYDDFVPHGMSPEVPYESRYFCVTVSADNEIISSDLSKILSVDEDSIKTYVDKAIATGRTQGNVNQFRFGINDSGDNKKILFLDCGRKFDAFRSFLLTSFSVGLGGCLISFLIFVFVSSLIAKPIAESYEKQKRFISDAGHEIKTPLTIISANVDLLEIEGEKEELTEIRTQTKRLTDLTKNLVYLSKMQEQEHTLPKVDFPLSDLVSETVNSFSAIFSSRNITCSQNILPDMTLVGSPDAVRQLVSVLCDNAVKYTPNSGNIDISLAVAKKSAVFTISNTTYNVINNNDLNYIFERFYRTDSSRNSETGGHGIGLSIAKAIVDAHGGSISATASAENTFTITASLPM